MKWTLDKLVFWAAVIAIAAVLIVQAVPVIKSGLAVANVFGKVTAGLQQDS